MDKFTRIEALVAPLDRDNVDTDAIIPKQFMKALGKTGFGPNLFDAWRYLDQGEPGADNARRPLNAQFVLNDARYQGAALLLARRNFGCGSSREHAPWALLQYGFRVIVASSFADIFRQNCYKNGILAISLDEEVIEQLFARTLAKPGYTLVVDLEEQAVSEPGGAAWPFEIDAFAKSCLLEGLDEIGLTLRHRDAILQFQQRHLEKNSWLARPA
ncbi:MAG: 3-isopropylmalate dehydratase small subunit [Pseudomonadota bacterium]